MLNDIFTYLYNISTSVVSWLHFSASWLCGYLRTCCPRVHFSTMCLLLCSWNFPCVIYLIERDVIDQWTPLCIIIRNFSCLLFGPCNPGLSEFLSMVCARLTCRMCTLGTTRTTRRRVPVRCSARGRSINSQSITAWTLFVGPSRFERSVLGCINQTSIHLVEEERNTC